MCRVQGLHPLPYAIRSLQGYPGEFILDEHYNNVKVLDMQNQELFQLQMMDKETMSDWGICLSRNLNFWPLPSLTVFPQIMWQS